MSPGPLPSTAPSSMLGLGQLAAVLRKSWLVRRRRPILGLMELALPVGLFLLLAWVRSWFAAPPHGADFFPGLALFPLSGLLYGDLLDSRGLLEVSSGTVRGEGAANTTCIWERVVRGLDNAVACMDGSSVAEVPEAAESSLGRWLAQMSSRGPNRVSAEMTDYVERMQNSEELVDEIEDWRTWYFNSSWPADWETWAAEVDKELDMLLLWSDQGSVAPEVYNQSWLAWARDSTWDLDRIAEHLVRISDSLEENYGFSIVSQMNFFAKAATTGFLSFMLPLASKSTVRKHLDKLFADLHGFNLMVRDMAQGVVDLNSTRVAHEFAVFAWHLTFFLQRSHHFARFLSQGDDTSVDFLRDPDRLFDIAVGHVGHRADDVHPGSFEPLPSVTASQGDFQNAVSNGTFNAMRRLQAIAAELGSASRQAQRAYSDRAWRDDLVKTLARLMTSSFFEAVESMEEGDAEKLADIDLPSIERGWREKCPFRRDYLTGEFLADFVSRMRASCPFYAWIFANGTSNATQAVRALHSIAQQHDFGWLRSLTSHLGTWLRQGEVVATTRNLTSEALNATHATWQDDAERKDPVPALIAGIQAAYFQQRGERSECRRSNGSSLGSNLASQLWQRRILVAPYSGESARIVELLAVELTTALSTFRGVPDFWAELTKCPMLRGGMSRGIHYFMEEFIEGFPDQASLEAYALENSQNVLAALVFTSANSSTGDFPDGPLEVEYSIRMHAQILPLTSQIMRTVEQRAPSESACVPSERYYVTGFALLQDLLGSAVARLQAQRLEGLSSDNRTGFGEAGRNMAASSRVSAAYDLDVRAELFPKPAPVGSLSIMQIQTGHMVGPFLALALIPVITMHAKDIVQEKQDQLRDLLRMMGLRTWVYWAGLPLAVWLQLCVLLTFSLFILKMAGFFAPSNSLLLLVFLWLVALASASLASLASSLFWRAKVAAAVGGLIAFAVYLPALIYDRMDEQLSWHARNAFCLFSTTAMNLGFQVVLQWEAHGPGLQWSTLARAPPRYVGGGTPIDRQSLLDVCAMLVVDAIIYQVLAWYIEKVSPGTFGLPQPWHFPLTYCVPRLRRQARVVDRGTCSMNNCQPEVSDLPDEQDDITLSVQNLHKKYADGKHALRGVRFDLRRGSILGLLGENGAGKSTMIGLIIGLFPPTSGDVMIEGASVRDDSSKSRQKVGVCLQHNILHSMLSVEEHFQLLCRVKGLGARSTKQHVEQMLRATRLEHERHALVAKLSAGMKRCVSLGCALIGGSTVLALDEPTAGLDATSRHEIWKLLLLSKAGRTMLVSSHFMYEVDMLCDQVALLRKGELVVAGETSRFKQNYSGAYILRLDVLAHAHMQEIEAMVLKVLPTARAKRTVGTAVYYELPSSQRSSFPELISHLQDSSTQARLGIRSYDLAAEELGGIISRALSSGMGCAASTSSWDEPVENIQLAISVSSSSADKQDEAQGKSVSSLPVQDALDGGTNKLATRHKAPDAVALDPASEAPANAEPEEASQRIDEEALGKVVPDAPGPRGEGAEPLGGVALCAQQARALLGKRVALGRRDPRAWITQLVLPVVLASSAIMALSMRGPAADLPPLRMDRHMFEDVELDHSGGVATHLALSTPCSPEHPNASLGSTICGAVRQAGVYGEKPDIVDLQASGRSMGQLLFYDAHSLADGSAGAISVSESAAEPASAVVTLWLEPTSVHSLPVMLNLWNNARLRLLGFNGTRVQAWSDPLPGTLALFSGDPGKNPILLDSMLGLTLCLSLCFIAASYAVRPAQEAITRVKLQHFMTGVSPGLHMLTGLALDYITFSAANLPCLLLLQVFGPEAYTGENALPVCAMILLFGAAMIPLTLCVAPMFSNPAAAYGTLICVQVVSTTLAVTSVFVLDMSELVQGEGESDAWSSIDWRNVVGVTLLLLPFYCVGNGLLQVCRNSYMNMAYRRYGVCLRSHAPCIISPLAWDVSGKFICALALASVLWSSLAFCLEYQIFDAIWECRKRVSTTDEMVEPRSDTADQDKHACSDLVPPECKTSEGLIISNIHKVFQQLFHGRQNVHAVRGLNARVHRGDAFGLLGENGAGKTTALRVLVGELCPSLGDASVEGLSIRWARAAARSKMGYCPQADALPDRLTVEEALQMVAGLRGASGCAAQSCVDDFVERMLLEPHRATWTERLSGGNRRKLSVAAALLGRPRVVLLDEPTTGIDAGARLAVWRSLREAVAGGTAMVMTSHSVEEIEAVCSHHAVISRGALSSQGTPAQLRSTCGDGYLLTVHLCGSVVVGPEAEKPRDTARDYVRHALPQTFACEEEPLRLRFKFQPSPEMKGNMLRDLFTIMDSAVATGGALCKVVADYEISRLSADEVLAHRWSEDVDDHAVLDHVKPSPLLGKMSRLQLVRSAAREQRIRAPPFALQCWTCCDSRWGASSA